MEKDGELVWELIRSLLEIEEFLSLQEPFRAERKAAVHTLTHSESVDGLQYHHGPANLEIKGIILLLRQAGHLNGLLDKLQGAELGEVVLEGKCSIVQKRDRTVMATDADVSDTHLHVLRAAHLDDF